MKKNPRSYWLQRRFRSVNRRSRETFRELKGELGLRPIWHTREDRIQAHLFIAVLAYHAIHLIRTRLRDVGISLRWEGICHRLHPWVRVTSTIQTVNGQQIISRQDRRPTAEMAVISTAAGVTPAGNRVRTRYPA